MVPSLQIDHGHRPFGMAGSEIAVAGKHWYTSGILGGKHTPESWLDLS